ncbi:MAG: hypothetical protein JNM62_08415 [Flavobacteriales bacterium]|nr:hypothetical protein [Flavobacteriales bacterium]
MKKILNYLLAVFLLLFGGSLLVIGYLEGQGLFMMLAAALAVLAGLVALLLQTGIIGRRAGFVLGIVFAALALALAYQNFRTSPSAYRGSASAVPLNA